MAVRRWVVCLFRQAIETRYRKKVNRSCNANRHHPSECHSPVWQFCEPTGPALRTRSFNSFFSAVLLRPHVRP